jgi:hypothetical protein
LLLGLISRGETVLAEERTPQLAEPRQLLWGERDGNRAGRRNERHLHTRHLR